MHPDLNLLRVLVAVDDCRQVSLAARQLRMTQPGVSNALNRLRVEYDDPLFVRTGRRMQPTPRATSLIETSRTILDLIKNHMETASIFLPNQTQTEFRLALSDIGEMVFLPWILNHLRLYAPGAAVRAISLPHVKLAAAMQDGDIDLAIGYFPDLRGSHVYQQKLFSHEFVCLLRVDHPFAKQRLTLRRFLQLDHAVVEAEGRSQEIFEGYIRRHRIRRRVVLHTPHFMSIPHLIANSDLIATVPLAVGEAFAQQGKIRLLKPPFDLPSFNLKQHWHTRVNKDARNRWLRQQVYSLFGSGFLGPKH